jgi:hypothetical protein
VAIDEIETEVVAGQAGYDMANLRPTRTGLPFIVFVSQKGGARHDVRIKLARSAKVRASEMVTVAVRPVPRVIRGTLSAGEFDQTRRWIELNERVLVGYWNGEIEYTEDMLEAIKPLNEAERP